ncbi:MAG: DUF4258 domain-containing protein [Thermodesulfobacteriota bacterium]|nr:DUF4258 domain-containing protein [Thermodesulfobacteriota bacterium]
MEYIFRVHATQRMFQRRISQTEVLHVLKHGETIEEYPDDQPYPSKLVLGWSGSRPLHVVVSENKQEGQLIIITVYEPDHKQWSSDFHRRKK